MNIYVLLELVSLDKGVEILGTFSTKEKAEEFAETREGYHYIAWTIVDKPFAEPDEEVF